MADYFGMSVPCGYLHVQVRMKREISTLHFWGNSTAMIRHCIVDQGMLSRLPSRLHTDTTSHLLLELHEEA